MCYSVDIIIVSYNFDISVFRFVQVDLLQKAQNV